MEISEPRQVIFLTGDFFDRRTGVDCQRGVSRLCGLNAEHSSLCGNNRRRDYLRLRDSVFSLWEAPKLSQDSSSPKLWLIHIWKFLLYSCPKTIRSCSNNTWIDVSLSKYRKPLSLIFVVVLRRFPKPAGFVIPFQIVA